MNSTELVIKIDIVYFLGLVGVLLAITWYGSNRFSALETSIDWIKRELDWMKDWMKKELEQLWDAMNSEKSRGEGLEESNSPLNPTETGWKYLKESGLEKIIDVEKREWLLQNLKNSLPPQHTEYDVQEIARRMTALLKDDPIMRTVKEYAFNNGLDVDIILRLGGLLLRDNFLGRQHAIASSVQK